MSEASDVDQEKLKALKTKVERGENPEDTASSSPVGRVREVFYKLIEVTPYDNSRRAIEQQLDTFERILKNLKAGEPVAITPIVPANPYAEIHGETPLLPINIQILTYPDPNQARIWDEFCRLLGVEIPIGTSFSEFLKQSDRQAGKKSIPKNTDPLGGIGTSHWTFPTTAEVALDIEHRHPHPEHPFRGTLALSSARLLFKPQFLKDFQPKSSPAS